MPDGSEEGRVPGRAATSSRVRTLSVKVPGYDEWTVGHQTRRGRRTEPACEIEGGPPAAADSGSKRTSGAKRTPASEVTTRPVVGSSETRRILRRSSPNGPTSTPPTASRSHMKSRMSGGQAAPM